MAGGPHPAILRRLRRLEARRQGVHDSDRSLLGRFAARRDDAAFAALVERHGP
jgi:hypothetical protein